MIDFKETNRNLKNNVSMANIRETSTKLYLVRPSFIFYEGEFDDCIYSIYKEVSDKFNVPISSVYITGSAHLGFSLKDEHDFSSNSDLDIAIIDSGLFNKIFSKILDESQEYQNRTIFRSTDDLKRYQKNICRGKIHPLYFPIGETKKDWDKFFSNISKTYSDFFTKITGCVYLSEECFRLYQENSLNRFVITKGVTT